MNRLQKKCLIATAGFHLLLLVILFVGPAFFSAHSKPDDSQVLDVIPANAIDAAFTSGVRGATPPPPTPVTPPDPAPPAPAPPTPAPQIVTPPAPVPAPEKIEKTEPVKPKETVKLTPVKAATEKPPAKPQQLALKPIVRTVPKNSPPSAKPDDSAQRQAQALKNAARSLKNSLSSSTAVDMPGDSTAAYANYASIVRSVYDRAWTPPDDLANENENVKVRVVIARDGTVVSATVVDDSGDPKLDASIRKLLDRIKFIAPFPDASTDKERTYTINFNPKTKQLLG